jgi:hypothetical protein
MLAKHVQAAKLSDCLEQNRIATSHVLEGMVGIAGACDHFQVATTELRFSVVDAGSNAIEVGEESLHPAPVAILHTGFSHAKNLLDASELSPELRNAGFAHSVVAEYE